MKELIEVIGQVGEDLENRKENTKKRVEEAAFHLADVIGEEQAYWDDHDRPFIDAVVTEAMDKAGLTFLLNLDT